MKKNYARGYKSYRKQYAEAKRIGNIKRKVRVLTRNQYNKAREIGFTNKQILKEQRLVSSKSDMNLYWKTYQKLVKSTIKPGNTSVLNNTYWGTGKKDENVVHFKKYKNFTSGHELGYHRTFKGLLRDKNALHMIIAFAIENNKDRKREEVLADYGY